MVLVNEKAETYLLAGIGLAEGVFKYYVRPELSARRAWTALGIGVLAYELACPEGELLSEGVDKALDKHPVLTTLLIGVTALHLLNKIPEKVDPYHQALSTVKRYSPETTDGGW